MHFDGGYFGGLARLGVFDPSQVQANATAHDASAAPVTIGTCTSDGAFIWNGSAWVRLSVGQKCASYSSVQGDVRTHDNSSPGGGVTINPAGHGPIVLQYDFDNTPANSTNPADQGKSLQVGPFKIPLGVQHYTVHWEGILPADWQSFIVPELAHDCSNCIFTSMEDATEGHPLGTLRDFFGDNLPAKVNKDLVTRPEVGFLVNGVVQSSYSGGGSYPLAMKISLPDQPIAVVARPDTGDTWGVYMVILPRDPTYQWDSTTNPYVLTFFWQQKPAGVWDWIKRIVGDIIDAIETVACAIAPVAIKTPPKDAITAGIVAGSVVLQMTGACTPSCPTGMNYVDSIKACACPAGMTYDATSKACIMAPSTFTIPWWAWVVGGLLVFGVIAKVSQERKKPSTTAPVPA